MNEILYRLEWDEIKFYYNNGWLVNQTTINEYAEYIFDFKKSKKENLERRPADLENPRFRRFNQVMIDPEDI